MLFYVRQVFYHAFKLIILPSIYTVCFSTLYPKDGSKSNLIADQQQLSTRTQNHITKRMLNTVFHVFPKMTAPVQCIMLNKTEYG